MGQRNLRINSLVERELGTILQREFELPEGALATITSVETSPTLQEAKVYISVSPEEAEPEVLKRLNRGIYGIQQMLNKRLRIRPVPKIIWRRDTAGKEVERVEELLEDIGEK